LWFTEYNGNKIGRITVNGNVTNEFLSPVPNANPAGIVAGPDGALWFVEVNGNRLGRITTAGLMDEYPIPTRFSRPFAIGAGTGWRDLVYRARRQ
jgi:virginiamycin B lyase